MPDCAGRANDVLFDWIGDADSRIGPFFELLIEAKYFWVPVSRVRRLALEPPADLRDLVWMPVSVVWVNGGESQGLMPARYPGSERSTDSAIQLGRKTDWKALEADTYIGLGQKCLMTDQAEIAVCDLRELELNA
jgi:type VI secretion system protein ImpE